MAENGNLSDNNKYNNINGNSNGNNNNTNTRTTTLENQDERTESDATHARLRNDLHPVVIITCLSCSQVFTAYSVLEIYEHYRERVHPKYYGRCLYCQGKVHQYIDARKQHIQTYHDCLRWKRGEDK